MPQDFFSQLALLHTAGHYSNFIAVSKGSASQINDAIGVDFGADSAVPPAWVLLFLTIPGATGHALLLVMLIAYPFVLQVVRKHRFEWFMFSHYALFLCMVALLCVHGTAAWLAPPVAAYWLALPSLLLIWQLSRRACPGRHLIVAVKAVGVRPGKIIRLEMSKPAPPLCSCLRFLGSGLFRKLGCGPVAARPVTQGGSAAALWASLQFSSVTVGGATQSLLGSPGSGATHRCRRNRNRRDIVPLQEQLKHVDNVAVVAVLLHLRRLQQSSSGVSATAHSASVQAYGSRSTARKSVQACMRQAAFPYVPGQYMFISVPQLAGGQWHPFTISSAPHTDRLVLNIKPSGDFTMKLYEACKQAIAGDITEEQVLAQLLLQANKAMPGAKSSGARLSAADVDFMSGVPKAAPAPSGAPEDSKRGSIFVPSAGSIAAAPALGPASALARLSFRPGGRHAGAGATATGHGRSGPIKGHSSTGMASLPRSIYVDGPFPAPAQLACTSYEYVVFVGGGIGGTPLGSFLSHLAHLSATARRVRELAMRSQPMSKFASSGSAVADDSVRAAWDALVPPLLVSPLQHAKVVWTSKTQPQMEALWDELLTATSERQVVPQLGTHCPAAGPGSSPLKRLLDVQLYATSRKVKPSTRQSIGMSQSLLNSLDPSKAAKLMRARRASSVSDQPPPPAAPAAEALRSKQAAPATADMAAIQEEGDDSDSSGSVQSEDAAAAARSGAGPRGPPTEQRRHGTISFSPFSKKLPKDTSTAQVDIELGRLGPRGGHALSARRGSEGGATRRDIHPQGATATEQSFANRVEKVNRSVDSAPKGTSGGVLGGIRRFLVSAGGDDSDQEDDTEAWEGAQQADTNGSDEETTAEIMGAVELEDPDSPLDATCDDLESDAAVAAPTAPVTVSNPLSQNGQHTSDTGSSTSASSRSDRAQRLAEGAASGGGAQPQVASSNTESGFSEAAHSALQTCVLPGRPKFDGIFQDMLQRVWADQQRRHAALSLLSDRGVLPEALLPAAEGSSSRTIRVGVFFCGPRPMGDSLKAACQAISRDFVPLRPATTGLRQLSIRADFHKESFW